MLRHAEDAVSGNVDRHGTIINEDPELHELDLKIGRVNKKERTLLSWTTKAFCGFECFLPSYTISNCDICVWLLNARCSLGSPRLGRPEILRATRRTDLKMRGFENRSTTLPLVRQNISLALLDILQLLGEGSGQYLFGIHPISSKPRIPDDLERIRISFFPVTLRTCRRLRLPIW